MVVRFFASPISPAWRYFFYLLWVSAAWLFLRFKHLCSGEVVKAKKCKVLPITGHEGPEGEHKYSSTLSSTSALDRGGWFTPRPPYSRKTDPVPIL
jgi:hypothetical protein